MKAGHGGRGAPAHGTSSTGEGTVSAGTFTIDASLEPKLLKFSDDAMMPDTSF